MNSSAEQRRHARKEIKLGILFKYGMEWFPADIRDVTIGGISFITGENFELGTEINIFFGDSNAIGSNDFNTVVLRSKILESYLPPKYLVAVKLTEANAKYVNDVKAYLKEIDTDSNSE